MTPRASLHPIPLLAICSIAACTTAFVVQPQIKPYRVSPDQLDNVDFTGYHRRQCQCRPTLCSSLKQDHDEASAHTSNFQDSQGWDEDSLDQEIFLKEMDQSLSVLGGVVSSSSPSWKFQGHDIFCQVSLPTEAKRSTKLPTVVLVHGFGCSTVYWRDTVRALTRAGFAVHTLDLLGQGKSAKPSFADGIEYSTNLWAQQVDAYCQENMEGEDIVLLGNSVGSLVALCAATGDFQEGDKCESGYIRQHIDGVGMFNCGIGLNIRNMVKDPKWNPIQRFLLNLIFDSLESLVFGNVALMGWILNKVTKDMLRNTLTELYKFAPEKVDDELVDSFYLPAKQDGSAEVLTQILTNDPGLTPVELQAKHGAFLNTLPIHLVWGDEDTVVPLQWQVGQFYSHLAADKDNAITMDIIHGGHILFDEVSDVSNGAMLRWLNTIAQQEEPRK